MDGIEIELEPQIKQTGGQIKQQQTNNKEMQMFCKIC